MRVSGIIVLVTRSAVAGVDRRETGESAPFNDPVHVSLLRRSAQLMHRTQPLAFLSPSAHTAYSRLNIDDVRPRKIVMNAPPRLAKDEQDVAQAEEGNDAKQGDGPRAKNDTLKKSGALAVSGHNSHPQ